MEKIYWLTTRDNPPAEGSFPRRQRTAVFRLKHHRIAKGIELNKLTPGGYQRLWRMSTLVLLKRTANSRPIFFPRPSSSRRLSSNSYDALIEVETRSVLGPSPESENMEKHSYTVFFSP